MKIHSFYTIVALRRAPLAVALALALSAVAASAHNGARNAGPVPAGSIQVQNCGDSGDGSLRAAIVNATDGQIIDLTALDCPDGIVLGSALEVTAVDLQLNGPGRDALTISGNDATLVLHSTGNITINDLTLADGYGSGGYGGCLFVEGDLTLNGSRVTGCRAGSGANVTAFGGAVDVLGNLTMQSSEARDSLALGSERAEGGGVYVFGDADVTDSVIAGNTATSLSVYSRGGGLFATGDISIEHSKIDSNEAISTSGTATGGGLAGIGGSITIDVESSISFNQASSDDNSVGGGGISSGESGGNPTLVDIYRSQIESNVAETSCTDCVAYGGGVDSFGRVQISNSTLYRNRISAPSGKTAGGGGVATHGSSSLVWVGDSTISGNVALAGDTVLGKGGFGGGVATLDAATFGATSATIAFNEASRFGGGIASGNSSGSTSDPSLTNSIVANNEAPANSDFASTEFPVAFTFLGYGNLVTVPNANITLPSDTLVVDPLLLPLANNGGRNLTHAFADCSPARDAGVDSGSLPNTDERGLPYVRVFGAAVDIGAFELQPDADHIFGNGFDPSLCP